MACVIFTQSPWSTGRSPIRSRLADSMSAAAPAPTAAHSSSVFGCLSSMPAAETIVATESNTT